MTDDQLPRIVLEPIGQASAQNFNQPVPMQPVPQRAPAGNPNLKARQTELQQQLDDLTKDEASLLSNMKDWVSKLQGDETNQQGIERELLELNSQITTQDQTPTGPSTADLEKQLREAEGGLKVILMQQKIEEKKAFDNYSAGGIKREELLQAMEHINSQFDQPVAEAKAKVAVAQAQLSGKPTPVAQPSMPESQPEPAVAQAAAQVESPNQSHVIQALGALGIALSPEQQQALQSNPGNVARSKDGNGIVVGGVHFFDADLIRAGLGAEDVLNLPQEV